MIDEVSVVKLEMGREKLEFSGRISSAGVDHESVTFPRILIELSRYIQEKLLWDWIIFHELVNVPTGRWQTELNEVVKRVCQTRNSCVEDDFTRYRCDSFSLSLSLFSFFSLKIYYAGVNETTRRVYLQDAWKLYSGGMKEIWSWIIHVFMNEHFHGIFVA